MFDNRVFNVNGKGTGWILDDVIDMVFMQQGENTTCKAWSQSKEHGLILHWYGDNDYSTNLLTPLSAEECRPMIKAWLAGDFAKTCFGTGPWDGDADHDGHNGVGWRVYCEDWGHVAGYSSAICAIQPVFVWYGK